MKLEFALKSDAQALADKIHAHMIVKFPDTYAVSVVAGHTKAWCIPYQVTDESGKVLNPAWCVNVKDRCVGALTSDEKATLK